MGLALMAVIWLITLASTYFFVAKTWWLPVGRLRRRGIHRRTIRADLCADGNCFSGGATLAGLHRLEIPGAAFLAAGAVFARQYKLEIIWTVLTTILFIGLNLMGSSVWASQRFDPAGAGAVQVEVTGMQFAWYFRYPGPDGKYGSDQSEADGSFGRRRGGGGTEHFRSGGER